MDDMGVEILTCCFERKSKIHPKLAHIFTVFLARVQANRDVDFYMNKVRHLVLQEKKLWTKKVWGAYPKLGPLRRAD